ncbi:hypothetical protein [Bradyrhizobium retamae]|uniref:hypothetical protein n=1 Tax=Bradyrhizobium retamae TaxID=1300035 RepID=UPI000AB9D1E5|nr:hypothetical protein [Bradyrhizobium retamae]
MSTKPSLSDNNRYEQACDQAIAMCDGNLRSTIKALIMANEYLEIELEALQAAIAAGCVPAKAFSSEVDTGSHSNQACADCVDLSAAENASKQRPRASSNAA